LEETPSQVAVDSEAGSVSLVHDTDFVKFWVGQSIAVFGAQFSPLAIQVIAIDILNVSNFQLGVLGFVFQGGLTGRDLVILLPSLGSLLETMKKQILPK
jgi:hypothetical protein